MVENETGPVDISQSSIQIITPSRLSKYLKNIVK